MKLLITGCAGFIGARTSQLALDNGHSVVGLDNLNDYYDVQLKDYRLKPLLACDGFQFQQIDIEDGDALKRVFAENKFDAVINLAARAGVRASIQEPHVYLSTNSKGTLNLLELAAASQVSKFVLASTSSLYAGHPLPFVETANVARPISPYAATKLAAEALAYVWHQLHQIDVSVVRYFTVYGPSGRPDMSPFRFAEWIRRGDSITLFGDGSATRDFTYIDDIAAGTLAALKRVGYEVINLGGGNRPLSIKAMIGQLARHIGQPPVIDYHQAVAADMQDTSANIDKARKILGWEPKISPEEGLRMTAEWHCNQTKLLNTVKL